VKRSSGHHQFHNFGLLPFEENHHHHHHHRVRYVCEWIAEVHTTKRTLPVSDKLAMGQQYRQLSAKIADEHGDKIMRDEQQLEVRTRVLALVKYNLDCMRNRFQIAYLGVPVQIG
jgi:hypothetical protein